MLHVQKGGRLTAVMMVGVAGFFVSSWLASVASAAPEDTPSPSFVVEKSTVQAVEKDGVTTFSVIVTNLTRDQLPFTATNTDENGACPVSTTPAVVAEPLQSTTLKFTVSASGDACPRALADSSQKYNLSAGGTDLPLTVNGESEGEINWTRIVCVYGLAAVGALVLLAATAVCRRCLGPTPKKFPKGLRLKHLDASYSFKDSWASNVTLVVGVLTAVLGSADVLKAISATATEQAQQQAVAASAVSVAMVALAPVVVQMFRRREDSDGPKYAPTIDGVVLAGSITLSAGAGLAYLIGESSSKLDLGGIESLWWVLVAVLVLILAAYGVTSLWSTLVLGMAEKSKQPSETIEAAKLVASAIAGQADNATLADSIESTPAMRAREMQQSVVL